MEELGKNSPRWSSEGIMSFKQYGSVPNSTGRNHNIKKNVSGLIRKERPKYAGINYHTSEMRVYAALANVSAKHS